MNVLIRFRILKKKVSGKMMLDIVDLLLSVAIFIVLVCYIKLCMENNRAIRSLNVRLEDLRLVQNARLDKLENK